MEEKNYSQESLSVYETMCAAYEKADLKFDRHDEDLTITFGMGGDDLPMEFIVMVTDRAKVVRLYSRLPFEVAKEKITEVALGVVYVNSTILNGAFDLDISTGRLSFNVLAPYHGSVLGDEVFLYMLGIASGTIDRFNDRFLALSKGMIDLQGFIKMQQEDK